MSAINSEVWFDSIWRNKYKQYIKKHSPMYSGIIPYLEGKILDIGVGVTDMYKEGQDVTGVDFSSECIEIMKERHPFGVWLKGDAFNIQLPSEAFDTVIIANLIEHFNDAASLLKEVKRLMKPSGTAIITVPMANFSKGHVLPEWSEESIDSRIGCHFHSIEYALHRNHWWIVRCKK